MNKCFMHNPEYFMLAFIFSDLDFTILKQVVPTFPNGC